MKVYKVEAIRNEATAASAYTVYVTADGIAPQSWDGMNLDSLYESASRFIADRNGVEVRKEKIGYVSRRAELGNWA